MKLFLTSLLVFTIALSVAHAQLGRHEQPIDTLPIGGDIQERKMDQMQNLDQLREDLVALGDSIQSLLPHKNNDGADDATYAGDRRALAEYRERIDGLVNELKEVERDEELMKEGQVLLKEARREMRKSRKQ